MFKKISATILALAMATAMSTGVFAAQDNIDQSNLDSSYQIKSVYTNQEALIYDYYNSINKSDWSEWASLYSATVENEYLNFVSQEKI